MLLEEWTFRFCLLSSFFVSNPVTDINTLLIGTKQFAVHLQYGCSGSEGISLFLTAATCFYLLMRNQLTLSTWGAAAMLLIGVFISFAGNILRISLLIAIGSHGYGEYAMGGFHSSAGTIFFFIIIGSYALIVHRYFIRTPQPLLPKIRAILSQNPAAPYLIPFMALIAATIFLRIFTIHWDWLYPIKIIWVTGILWYYRQVLTDLPAAPGRSYLFAAIGGIIIAYLWMALPDGAHVDPPGISNFNTAPQPIRYAWLFFRVSGSVMIIPIIEELIFRGYLSRVIIHFDFHKIPMGTFSPLSFAASAIAFGILHNHLAGGIIAGILFNIILMYTKSLRAVIVSHIIANAVIAFDVIQWNHWYWWG